MTKKSSVKKVIHQAQFKKLNKSLVALKREYRENPDFRLKYIIGIKQDWKRKQFEYLLLLYKGHGRKSKAAIKDQVETLHHYRYHMNQYLLKRQMSRIHYIYETLVLKKRVTYKYSTVKAYTQEINEFCPYLAGIEKIQKNRNI